MSAPNIAASTYVRRTVEQAAVTVQKPEDDAASFLSWEVTFLLGIIANLAHRGHGDAIRAAADNLADRYGVPAQAQIEAEIKPAAVPA